MSQPSSAAPPDLTRERDELRAVVERAGDAALARHNAEFDRWQAMTDRQREDAIRCATQ